MMKAAPIIAAAAVRKIGLKRIAPASSSAWRNTAPPRARRRMKSTSRIELRTMMPASAMKPIIEVAVNGAVQTANGPSTMPISVSGTGIEDHQRQAERAELGDDQQIDAEDRHAKAAPMSRKVT